MSTVTITSLRKKLFEYVEQAVSYNEVINVATKSGNAVILSEDDYNGMIETLYLNSVPGLAQSIKDAQNAPKEDFTPLSEVNFDDL